MNQKQRVIYYLMLSTIGVALIILMSRLAPQDTSTTTTIQTIDRLLLGGIFITICIFGFSLAIRPNWISGLTKQPNHDPEKKGSQIKKRRIQGHHPDCEQFEGHTIKINEKILCAGCTGLALGSIISIILMGAYVVLPGRIKPHILHQLIILGMTFKILNFIETLIPMKNSLLHTISNIFLVIGFSFIVVGIFQQTGSTSYGIITVIISLLFLDTRIQISSWQHDKICRDCSEDCKIY
ncbi:MAG: hypothetical protein SVM80_06400 [Halobacteriota archaeon]|nr:hypothetical protein [Halobacteriota archaeon]